MGRKADGTNYGNLALAALILGVGLSLFGVFAMVKSSTAQRWHVTEGVVIESKVIGGFDAVAKPRVSYRYEVDGKSYTSDRISFLLFGDDSHAEQVVAAYPQNRIVTVYYDPTNPAESVLEPRSSTVAILTLVAGVLCLGVWQWARVKVKSPRSSPDRA